MNFINNHFMKTIFFSFLFLISSFGFAQNNHIVKTEDGRRVLLKDNFTWEYIDVLKPGNTPMVKKSISPNSCVTDVNFKEPRLNSKVQSELKRGRASIKHIKKRVAKEYNCTIDEVQLLTVSENKQSGVYDFCVNGTKVKYKRVGNTIIKPLF